jgi:hypothetical protein
MTRTYVHANDERDHDDNWSPTDGRPFLCAAGVGSRIRLAREPCDRRSVPVGADLAERILDEKMECIQ